MVKSKRKLVFPVSVSRRVYRGGGKGNGFLVLRGGKAIAAGIVVYLTVTLQFAKRFAQGGGADAAEFSQLLHGDRPVDLGQGLEYPFGRSCRIGLRRRST